MTDHPGWGFAPVSGTPSEGKDVDMQVGWYRLAAVAAVVALAGCSSPQKSASSDPPPSTPSVSWDGAYRGTIQITGVGSGIDRKWCETDPQMTVQVAAGTLNYAMPHPNAPDNPTPVYTATIAPDGSFRSVVPSGVMTGRVAASHMTGMIDGSVCVYSFAMDRS
jgi:hypothetical protein